MSSAKWLCIAKKDIPALGLLKDDEGEIIDYDLGGFFTVKFSNDILVLSPTDIKESFEIED